MQRRQLLLAAALFLCGCAVETSEPAPQKTEEPTPSAVTETTNEYDALIADASSLTNYTAGVKLRYDMAYENGSRSVYDLDGVIEEDDSKIHLVQHINGRIQQGQSQSRAEALGLCEIIMKEWFHAKLLHLHFMYRFIIV